MAENTEPVEQPEETPEVEAHTDSVPDLQGVTEKESPVEHCISVLSTS